MLDILDIPQQNYGLQCQNVCLRHYSCHTFVHMTLKTFLAITTKYLWLVSLKSLH